jgi:hypothetical protein
LRNITANRAGAWSAILSTGTAKFGSKTSGIRPHQSLPELILIAGSVDILAELRHRGTPLYGLTNWSTETYTPAQERFAFLPKHVVKREKTPVLSRAD